MGDRIFGKGGLLNLSLSQEKWETLGRVAEDFPSK